MLHLIDSTIVNETKEVGQWLYNFLWDNTGDDIAFISFLDGRSNSWPHYAMNVWEQDRMEMFRRLVSNLTSILGTEEAAANWLFRSSAFVKVDGSVPFDFLADGSFDALYFLDTLIQAELKENEVDASRKHYLFKGSVSLDGC